MGSVEDKVEEKMDEKVQQIGTAASDTKRQAMGLFSHRKPGGEPYWLKLLLVTLALIYSLSASGVVFGYSGLYSVLVYDVGAFANRCPEGTPPDELPCAAQVSALSFMYTIGATTISGCAFAVGLFLDTFGPRLTVCLGSILLGTGLVFLGMAQAWGDYFYYISFFVMAVGGPCIFNSTYSFGELFPLNSSAIIGALSTGFNSSTIVLTVFSYIISSAGVSLKSVCLAYTALPVVVFLTSLFLFPDEPFSASSGKLASEADSENPDATVSSEPRFGGEINRVWTITLTSEGKYPADVEGSNKEYPDLPPEEASDPEYPTPSPESLTHPLLRKQSSSMSSSPLLRVRRRRSFLFDDGPPRIYNTAFRDQVSSPIFWSMALVTAFVVLRVNYYIQTLYSQLLYTANLQHPGDPAAAIEEATYYSTVFNLMLPPGGIMMIPVVGYVMVELGFVPTFLVIAILQLLFCVVNLLQTLPTRTQVLAFSLYAMLRPFVFGGMAAYIGRIFGFNNFGKLYGLVRVTGACAVALEFPLETITVTVLGGNYIYVNVAFLIAGLSLFAFPVYLWKNVFYGYFFRPPTVIVPRS